MFPAKAIEKLPASPSSDCNPPMFPETVVSSVLVASIFPRTDVSSVRMPPMFPAKAVEERVITTVRAAAVS